MGQRVAPVIWVAGGVVLVLAAAGLLINRPTDAPVAGTKPPAVATGSAAAPAGPETQPRSADVAGSAVPAAPQTGADSAPAEGQAGADPLPPGGAQTAVADAAGSAGPEASAPQQGTAAAAPLPAPLIDTFSHGKDGSAVLAGRSPGSRRVELRLQDVILASARSDGAGRFAMLFDLPPVPEARSLVLRSFDAADQPSAAAELLVAPAPVSEAPAASPLQAVAGAEGAVTPAVPVALAGTEALAQDGAAAAPVPPVAPAEAVAATVAAAPVPPPAAVAEAPSSLLLSDQGVSVLRPQLREGLTIDAIAYGAEGQVEVSGRSLPETDIRIYLDNRRHLDVRTDARGGWSAALPEVSPGLYVLRADQTAADGRVIARAETPFLREDPVSLGASGAEQQSGVITVQPGYTLWGIARARFGDGFQYVKVFEANRDQIRDPDLIYPGQIFKLPEN